METAIVSLICIALMALGGMTMSNDFLSSADTTTAGLEQMNETSSEINRTDISILSVEMDGESNMRIVLKNTGQTKLADFDYWDVIIEYHKGNGDLIIEWLDYTTDPSGPYGGEWTLVGIYSDWDPVDPVDELFEPGILNPDEEMEIYAKVLNPVKPNRTDNRASVITPNGIDSKATFES